MCIRDRYKDIEQQVLKNNLQVKNNEATIQNIKFNRVTETTQDTTSDMDNMINNALYSMDSIMNNTEASPDAVSYTHLPTPLPKPGICLTEANA